MNMMGDPFGRIYRGATLDLSGKVTKVLTELGLEEMDAPPRDWTNRYTTIASAPKDEEEPVPVVFADPVRAFDYFLGELRAFCQGALDMASMPLIVVWRVRPAFRITELRSSITPDWAHCFPPGYCYVRARLSLQPSKSRVKSDISPASS